MEDEEAPEGRHKFMPNTYTSLAYHLIFSTKGRAPVMTSAIGPQVHALDSVVGYVKNQVDHHRTRTFQEEFIEFLEMNKIDCDESHLWE